MCSFCDDVLAPTAKYPSGKFACYQCRKKHLKSSDLHVENLVMYSLAPEMLRVLRCIISDNEIKPHRKVAKEILEKCNAIKS